MGLLVPFGIGSLILIYFKTSIYVWLFPQKKEPRLKRRGFLLVVTSTGVPAVFLCAPFCK